MGVWNEAITEGYASLGLKSHGATLAWGVRWAVGEERKGEEHETPPRRLCERQEECKSKRTLKHRFSPNGEKMRAQMRKVKRERGTKGGVHSSREKRCRRTS